MASIHSVVWNVDDAVDIMSLQRIFLNRKKARRVAVGWRMGLILVNVLVSVGLGLWLMLLEWEARLPHYGEHVPKV